jgi:AcrR family transcriptional regulator
MTTSSTATTWRPYKRDRQRRERSLLDAANVVFAERGYDAATTREVAERAGCSEGLIHRYFGGKRGLLLATMESNASATLDDFSSTLAERYTVRDEIEQALSWSLRVFWEHRDFMRVSLAQATIDPEVGQSTTARVYNRSVNLILDRLRRHKTAGRIRPEADIDAVAQAVAGFGFALGFMGQVVIGMDREYSRRLAVAFADQLSRGISAWAPHGRRARNDDPA